MAVSTTLMGLLPVMLGTATGAEVMKRIGALLFGGLLSALALTLLVLPAIYYIWKRWVLRNEISTSAIK